jgi:hypothetical protein
VCVLLCGAGAIGPAQASPGDVLVGVTWSDGALVSFDPSSGQILQRYVPVDPRNGDESFIALAYDRNHGKLHVLSQVDRTIFTINADTLQLANVVPLRIDVSGGATDVTGLAYDPTTDTLYATVAHGPDSGVAAWDELVKVDPWSGETSDVGRIDGPWITGLAFHETERMLYALGVSAAGSWDSQDTSRLIRIDPATAAFETVSQTDYHTMLGLALKEPGAFFSWINGTSHFFGETSLLAPGLTPLGGDDASGPIAAMILKTFDLPPQPVERDSSPFGFLFEGRVTAISDPHGRLRGLVHKGQAIRGQINYDATAPFKSFVSGEIATGVSLQSGKLRYIAPDYAASIMNDRLDPGDAGPTDEFRLRGYTPSNVVISWTLVDRSGNAVDAATSLPQDFDLSRWQTNTLSVTAYDACCRDPLYRVTGTVDDIRRRPGPGTRPLKRPGRRDGK